MICSTSVDISSSSSSARRLLGGSLGSRPNGEPWFSAASGSNPCSCELGLWPYCPLARDRSQEELESKSAAREQSVSSGQPSPAVAAGARLAEYPVQKFPMWGSIMYYSLSFRGGIVAAGAGGKRSSKFGTTSALLSVSADALDRADYGRRLRSSAACAMM